MRFASSLMRRRGSFFADLQVYEVKNVGAGLPAKAVCQPKMFQLTHRIREQARSHTSPLPHWDLSKAY